MRYENARDESRSNTEYYPMTYNHPDGQQTQYDLQQIRDVDDTPPVYVISESENNTGRGFDSVATRDAVAQQAAKAIIALNDPTIFPDAEREMRPSEINLYQQRPDGDFERVDFREIGRDARSNVDIEMKQNDPQAFEAYQQEQSGAQQAPLQFTETSRTRSSWEELSEVVGELHASKETLQQKQSLNEQQWKELSGPSIDRAAEIDNQRAQEQVLQMNQHQEQDGLSYDR